MPSSHPIPTIAALALSLYASDRRVEKLPTVTEYAPTSRVEIAHSRKVDHVVRELWFAGRPEIYVEIGGDL